MPVGSISLPVSHLPSASSFYLAVLQPLNYRFVEECEGRIGLGSDGTAADFYLVQQIDGPNRSPTNITFNAPSAFAIDLFAAAAARYGGAIHSYPILKDCETGYYAASIIDLDGNKITAACEDPRMSTYSSSSNSFRGPPTVIQRSNSDPPASYSGADGNLKVRITTHTTSTTPPSGDQGGSSGDSGNGNSSLVTALLGVAAGAALGYVVGRDNQNAGPAIARAVQAAPAAFRALESVTSGQRAIAAPPAGYPPQHPPPVARASTYHGSEFSAPWAIEAPPSPPAEYGYRSAVSESASFISSRKGGHPLMIEAPPSRYGTGSIVTGRQTLPPSPPSVRSSVRSERPTPSHHSRRSISNERSPAHSTHSRRSRHHSPSPTRSSSSRSSKSSKPRSSSMSSSSRTVRPEDYQLPPSVTASRVSAASAARTAAVSSKAAHEYTLPSSKASSTHTSNSRASGSRTSSSSKLQEYYSLPATREGSVAHSRQPHEYSLPSSRAPSDAPSSRKPHEYSLPSSRAPSDAPSSKKPHEYSLPSSRAPSDAPSSRKPHDYSLPPSKATSVMTSSTLKPPRSALGLKKGSGDCSSDEESLAPEDSISQVSSGAGSRRMVRKKVHRHRSKKGDEAKDGGSQADSKTKRSVFSLPLRDGKREKDTRAVATEVGA